MKEGSYNRLSDTVFSEDLTPFRRDIQKIMPNIYNLN